MELRWAYEVLEVMPGADRRRVHTSYRELARRWHPDRLQADPAGAWRGAERLRQVNAAYAAIRAAGFPAAPAATAWPAWQPWTTTTWPHERAATPAPSRTPMPRAQPPAPARQAQPDDSVSLLWALLGLLLLVMTLGLLDGLGLDEQGDD